MGRTPLGYGYVNGMSKPEARRGAAGRYEGKVETRTKKEGR
jgi:hypothetical protein